MDMSQTAMKENIETINDTVPTLIAERGSLLKALGHIQAVVEKRNTIAILANVKLQAQSGILSLTATDMEIAVTERIAANIIGDGAVTVPAHTLYDIVRKLPDGAQIEIEKDSKQAGHMELKAGNAKFSLPYLSAEDFPLIDQGDVDHLFNMNATELLALINKTRFAVSTDETRYYLNGIFLHAKDDTLIAVATDGHRLAKLAVTLPEGAAGITGVLVPRKTALELAKLIEDAESEVEVSVSRTKISFICGNANLISKLIEGSFPEYENVIPQRSENVMEVNVQQMINAVDRIATMSSEKTRAIRLSVQPGRLELMAANENSGSGVEILDVSYNGKSIEAGFNSRYVLEVLSGIEGETVQFVFSEKGEATLVFDVAQQGALYVIMPMRL